MKRFVFLLSLFLICNAAFTQAVEKTFYFSDPKITTIDAGDQILFEGCNLSAIAGQPAIPWQQVCLMLPPGQEAIDIEVVYGDFIQIDAPLLLAPYQPSRPLSEVKNFRFVKDEKLYSSTSIYPEKVHGELITSWLNGVGYALTTVTPVQYIPAQQSAYFAGEVTVKIFTAPVKFDRTVSFQGSAVQAETSVRIAQNPEMIGAYEHLAAKGRTVPETDLLIITKASYAEQFDSYRSFLLQKGFTTSLETVESIAANGTGSDLQEKIRNFVIEKYNESGIHSLLLGGDVDIVPARGFYCYVESGGGYSSDNIPADLYYAALDGTWNDDNDNRWGEPGDRKSVV